MYKKILNALDGSDYSLTGRNVALDPAGEKGIPVRSPEREGRRSFLFRPTYARIGANNINAVIMVAIGM